jgi:hypothetical protein
MQITIFINLFVIGLSYHKIHNINAVYSSISRIQITINDKSDGDIYTCKALDKNGTITTKSLKVVAKGKIWFRC